MADNNSAGKLEQQVHRGAVEYSTDDKPNPVFVNHTAIVSTPDECLFSFGIRTPDAPMVIKPVVNVLTTMMHAKQIVYALQQQITAYEETFGEIEIDITKRMSPAALKKLGVETNNG